MRKLKKAFSLTLALALSLTMAVPAMAAGETTIQDDNGFSYTLSKPVVGTRNIDGIGLFYQIPEGTIITPVLPEGTIKEVNEYNEVSYKLADDEEGRRQIGSFEKYADDYLDGYYDFVITYFVGELVDASELYGPGYEGSWESMEVGHLEGVNYDGDPIQPLSEGLYSVFRKIDCDGSGVDPNESESTSGGFNGSSVGGYHGGISSEVRFEIVADNGSTTPPQPEQPAGTTASPTNDKLEVNENAADPTVYKINGSNYFKIRDVAALLNGTEKQFAVGYDGEKNAVTATTGQGYDKQPGDLAGAPAGGSQSAEPSNDVIYVNGEKITAEVYKINGSNYFKLRDLGKALNFYVGWSADRGMYIETGKPYSE